MRVAALISLLVIAYFLLLPAKLSANSATILIYHHVSDKTPPSTSISPEKFAEHMQFLSQNHTVIALPELVAILQAGDPLPDKAVAITFDDGFRNILENGDPILQQYQFPYTIFINPFDVGEGSKMTWEELANLGKRNVTIANHFWDHRHMLDMRGFDDEAAWLEETKALIIKAESSIEKHLGQNHQFIAYPFGEYDLRLQKLLRELGYVGFAQHSGAVGAYTDWTAVPRFPAAGIYSNLRTLRTKLASLNMPILDNSQQKVAFWQKPEEISFRIRLKQDDLRLSQVGCFYQGNPMPVEVEGDSFQVSVTESLKLGRSRVNCTAPSKSKPGRFYWHSQPWFIARPDGSWPD